MATLLLGAAGGALGGVFGPVGAIIGKGIGTLAGALVDRFIVNALTPPAQQVGPRLTTTNIQTSTEGQAVDRVFGRARVTGQVIWATRFEEVVTKEKTGGKGGGQTVVTTTYSYFGNFAVGLCAGPIAGIGRIWADGSELDQTLYEIRSHRGTEGQAVDPLIEAKEGTAPAYRGLAYIVFERLPLQEWGNRLPQISVEVFRPTGDMESLVQGVALIGGNEFGYDPITEVRQVRDDGGESENRHTLIAATDWVASIDRLQMLAPNLKSVMLVVPWFGDDLRCGQCTVRPKVDSGDKPTSPYSWKVGPLTRDTALVVTYVGGSAAYGGTPADEAVIRAIQDLTARGIDVTYNPFVMMDIGPTNTLPNPYSNGAAVNGQAAFPWRGRVTCSPAAGFTGSPDKTATAATQVTAFVGTAAPGDFSATDSVISYSGPAEWSYRRFVLHNAKLAQVAGGVHSFLIGSEMVGLTQVRSSASAYPFVTALKTLAGDVAGMLPGVDIGYAADWTEYNSHRPGDGSGDLYFNLDPLWSDSAIDFVGIDNYMPLADWRDGSEHLDFDPAGPTTIYDAAYLDGNVEGGEAYDWYYASYADRDLQNRQPITDGAYGKPWVYRQKDIRNWWSHAHHNRPGGVENASATAWTAQGKPVRFIEMGCPAVDKGANQPNVFVDPKSSESFYPYYSSHARDDAIQRAYIAAMIGHYADAANNPVSTVYGTAMLDLAHSHVWCWDARPWPSFDLDEAWGDAANWEQGHWISGRLGTAPAPETIAAILDDAGFTDYAIEPIPAVVDGLTTGTLTTARAALDALQPVYQFDGVESEGLIKFVARLGRAPIASISGDDLVLSDDSARRFKQTRAQETDLPQAIKLTYGDPARDDQSGSVDAKRMAGQSLRTLEYSVPAIIAEEIARGICEVELHSAWTGRERASFGLPPSYLALDAGDVVTFEPTENKMRLSGVTDSTSRAIEAFRVEPMAISPQRMPRSNRKKMLRVLHLDAVAVFVDGPLLDDGDPAHAGYVGGLLLPFRHGLAVYRSPDLSGYELDTMLPTPATMGVTMYDFYSGPVWRWDRVGSLYVRLTRGSLTSAGESAVLNGANPLLVQNADGEWELLQFATATLIGTRSYMLTNLLRGQRGSEHAMRNPVAAGARVIVPDSGLKATDITPAMVGLDLNWRYGPADRDIGSTDYVDQVFTIEGKGERPLSPVQLAAEKQTSGDFDLSWIRRTRIGGDAWGTGDVPLGEESERYDLEIRSGGSTVRTVSSLTDNAFTYTLAMQVADFGAEQSSLTWRVYQLSATYGRGIAGTYP